MEESIWGRKDLIGGKHLGEERFNWRKAFGEERFNWRKAFGGGKI